MRIKSTTAFRAYANARAKRSNEQAAATARFMVKSVNRDGSISRMKPTRETWLRDTFATVQRAQDDVTPGGIGECGEDVVGVEGELH